MVAVAWLATGLVVGVVATRTGHHARAWFALGIALGPLAIPLLFVDHRRAVGTPPILLEEGHEGPGARVLVVICGDGGEVADLVPPLRTRPQGIGMLALARPVDVDTATEPRWGATKEEAAKALDEAAAMVEPHRPRLLLLPGANARAVARYVVANRIDEVAVLGHSRLARAVDRHHELRHRVMVDGPRTRAASSRR